MRSFVTLVVVMSVIAAGIFYYMDRSNDTALPGSGFLNNPGMALAVEKGCVACHTLDGTAGIGPTWKGTYGTLRTLSDGSQILADDAYLGRSIRNPAAEVVKGFENIMIAPELSEA